MEKEELFDLFDDNGELLSEDDVVYIATVFAKAKQFIEQKL